jgi:hypothetical protein
MDIFSLLVLGAGHLIFYRLRPSQFGDLWMPESERNPPLSFGDVLSRGLVEI